MDTGLILSIIFGSGILLLFIGIDLMISSRSLPLDKRMGTYATTPLAAGETSANAERRGYIGAGRFQKNLANDLSRAGLPLTVNEYVALIALATVLGLVLGYVLFPQAIIPVVILGFIGFFSPRWYVRYLQNRRIAAFDHQLAGTLSLLSNALRSGYGFSQAIDTVANEAAPPVSIEFKRVGREVALGLSMEDALENLLRRNPSLDLEMVVMAISINRQTGGNLSEVLDQIATTIRDRVRLIEELRTLTAQQRFTATVLTLLPPALMGFIYIANPSYLAYLWENTCGWVMLAAGGALMLIGYFVIRRIMAIKF